MDNFFSLPINTDNYIFINLNNIKTLYYKEYCIGNDPVLLEIEWTDGKTQLYHVRQEGIRRLEKLFFKKGEPSAVIEKEYAGIE